ncbi:MAG: rod shape-determining protein RodA [Candidatus Kapabacteria bacterium]|jgi:rod shape determining protein RodA|nr:rod shape-determining protein RodA [Candidatus Kapabacteria bacterium]
MSTILFDDDDVALQRRVNDLLDWGLVLAVFGVLAIGLISIFSATAPTFITSGSGLSATFLNQLKYAAIGLAGAVTMFYLPERWFRDLAWPLYGVGVLFLVAVLIPGVGKVVNGQQCWIEIGSFSFQPSELAKLTTLLALARHASEKGVDVNTIRDGAIALLILIIPVGLIMLQPDTGSATVFFAMGLGLYLWLGGDLFALYVMCAAPFVAVAALYGVLFDAMIWFFIASALMAIGAFLFRRNAIVTAVLVAAVVGGGFLVETVFTKLPPHQQNRLITLFEPERNPRGEGYHVIQSMLAVGSGGLTGKGFRKGTQTQLRYIPEQWTDFIYCVPTEEFGFVGGVTVIALLSAIILRAASIASIVRTRFASVIAFGFASMMLYHTIVNIGMAIGVFPVMGIPLPFLSAGGTALIINMSFIGLLLNFYKTRRRRASSLIT